MENLEQEMYVKISDFKEIVGSFSALLVEENEALNKFDVDKVSKLYERKAKSVEAYRSLVAYFIKNQETLSVIKAEEKQAIKDLSVKLEQLLHDNDILLKTRMETSQNVMNTIVNIAKMTNNANATSYGSQGRYSPLDNNKNALAVNRTL